LKSQGKVERVRLAMNNPTSWMNQPRKKEKGHSDNHVSEHLKSWLSSLKNAICIFCFYLLFSSSMAFFPFLSFTVTLPSVAFQWGKKSSPYKPR
jgi:uncharacterized membrane-anchored protein